MRQKQCICTCNVWFQFSINERFVPNRRQTTSNHHWNKNVVILTKFSSLAALEVVILTTSSAASDEHFIKMKTFPFQWLCPFRCGYCVTTEKFCSTCISIYSRQTNHVWERHLAVVIILSLHHTQWDLKRRPVSCLNIMTIFPRMGISILKMRWSSDRLIFMMGIFIPVRHHLYIELNPCTDPFWTNGFVTTSLRYSSMQWRTKSLEDLMKSGGRLNT